jgi:hypothetical protein
VALGAQLPVRLEPEVEERLETIAKRIGTTKSALIRVLAKTFVEQVVGEEGKVNLPPDWRQYLTPADGRTERHASTESSHAEDRERKGVRYSISPTVKPEAMREADVVITHNPKRKKKSPAPASPEAKRVLGEK